MQLDDGKVERIFDDEFVEAVRDADSIPQPVVCQRNDSRQNRRDSSAYASFQQTEHLNDDIDEFPSLSDVNWSDVQQNYLVRSESPDVAIRFWDCLARHTKPALQDAIAVDHPVAQVHHGEVQEEIVANQKAFVELWDARVDLKLHL